MVVGDVLHVSEVPFRLERANLRRLLCQPNAPYLVNSICLASTLEMILEA